MFKCKFRTPLMRGSRRGRRRRLVPVLPVHGHPIEPAGLALLRGVEEEADFVHGTFEAAIERVLPDGPVPAVPAVGAAEVEPGVNTSVGSVRMQALVPVTVTKYLEALPALAAEAHVECIMAASLVPLHVLHPPVVPRAGDAAPGAKAGGVRCPTRRLGRQRLLLLPHRRGVGALFRLEGCGPHGPPLFPLRIPEALVLLYRWQLLCHIESFVFK
mmetsp:Transcript_115663/g.327793  ORF Transcript_115663/g.327793 Transcript_115663/m.327793 type:complete len:215 (-) Transcript_115663:844-1488(-)